MRFSAQATNVPDEARSTLDCGRVDQILYDQLTPRGALGAYRDSTTQPNRLNQFGDRCRIRQLEIGLPPGHGEPHRLAGQPHRYGCTGSDPHRRDGPRLIGPLGGLGAAGDFDQKRARCHFGGHGQSFWQRVSLC
jgi:hypothetical protein